ncbi:ABC transporter ATP-binding protein [Paradesulfitobacterium ferrireducens]|uniref:ABC transporter ATP-binding protein n=1 Tax=Paradesulfitobacterium ferrireducens TaxID=2816476 RepID=UPI001A90A1BE|nr:ABC transporter ATP-binding protein [Paradesulfitobacterium ferrireducens]
MSFIVETEDLCKRYGDKMALDRLTLRLLQGQVTGLLGPNGAGKSTLLKAIVGLLQPSSGKIEVFGRKPHWSVNARIAYLPDRAQWYKYQTVESALHYGERVFPNFNLARAQRMAEQMGLTPSDSVAALSKGLEARLHLILCLAREAELVLLDEPFSGIDLVSREHIIQSIIDSTLEQHQTILITTHEIHEAESIFDHVIFLENGKLILEGETEVLRSEQGSIESIYRGLYR